MTVDDDGNVTHPCKEKFGAAWADWAESGHVWFSATAVPGGWKLVLRVRSLARRMSVCSPRMQRRNLGNPYHIEIGEDGRENSGADAGAADYARARGSGGAPREEGCGETGDARRALHAAGDTEISG